LLGWAPVRSNVGWDLFFPVAGQERVGRGHNEERQKCAEQKAADDDEPDLIAALGASTV
jgi:hypothetical protein